MKSLNSSYVLILALVALVMSACGEVPPDYFSKRSGVLGSPIALNSSTTSGTSWNSSCYAYTDLSHAYAPAYAIDNMSFTDTANRYTTTTVYSDAACTKLLYTYTIHSTYVFSTDGTRLTEQLFDMENVFANDASSAAKLSAAHYCMTPNWPVRGNIAVSSPANCGFSTSRSSTAKASSANGTRTLVLQNSSGSTIVYTNTR
jgi:hypothetical protein